MKKIAVSRAMLLGVIVVLCCGCGKNESSHPDTDSGSDSGGGTGSDLDTGTSTGADSVSETITDVDTGSALDTGSAVNMGSDSGTGSPVDSGSLDSATGTRDTAVVDQCPNDPLKTQPGVCECGTADVDANSNGVMDCLETPGWTDLQQYLVQSDGTRSLGDNGQELNPSRDQGSKIVFFDATAGDNATAAVYFFDGTQLVDDTGSPTNPQNGEAYGTDPLMPNEAAIMPFQYSVGMQRNSGDADPRLRTNDAKVSTVAGGFPDWFLYRRGQTHTAFDSALAGGRSQTEPMVVAAYGPLADGRAKMFPEVQSITVGTATYETSDNPFSWHTFGNEEVWFHGVFNGLEFNVGMSMLGTHTAQSFSGGPVTLLIEDCAWLSPKAGGILTYLPVDTTVRRSIVANSWDPEAHNQGYYTSDFKAAVTFEEMIFYHNGYKEDPRISPDPRRDIFSRNIYQGGGAQMGHTYRNIISANGASGGPQMRLGGLAENNLIIEGYWFSSTESNSPENPWLTDGNQTGQSAVVRNNVQLLYQYPTPNDPDTFDISDSRAQPGWGYALQGSSFGAVIEGNIISNALLADDLGVDEASGGSVGVKLATDVTTFQDGNTYTQQNNVIRDNIIYRTRRGLGIEGNWADARGIVVENNIFAVAQTIDDSTGNTVAADQIVVQNNRFYCDDALPELSTVGAGNTVAARADAATTENWPDPDRTLKRYVTEVLGLTLLDWSDDPYLDATLTTPLIAAGEAYDPDGLKTFMAVATNMRRGGVEAVPSSGKPSWTSDYAWDQRLTALAVVNWVRAGFGLPAL